MQTTTVNGTKRKRGRPAGVKQAQRSINATDGIWAQVKLVAAEKAMPAAEYIGQVLTKEIEGQVQLVDLTTLPKTTKEKFDTALRVFKRKLEAEFEGRVVAEVSRRTRQALPFLEAEEEKARLAQRNYRDLAAAVKTVLTPAQWNRLMMCVHPDTAGSVSTEIRGEMAALLNLKRLGLCGEKK